MLFLTLLQPVVLRPVPFPAGRLGPPDGGGVLGRLGPPDGGAGLGRPTYTYTKLRQCTMHKSKYHTWAIVR